MVAKRRSPRSRLHGQGDATVKNKIMGVVADMLPDKLAAQVHRGISKRARESSRWSSGVMSCGGIQSIPSA